MDIHPSTAQPARSTRLSRMTPVRVGCRIAAASAFAVIILAAGLAAGLTAGQAAADTPDAKPARPAADDAPAKGEEAIRDHAVIVTSLGTFVVRLDAEKAPVTVENFLRYIDDGFYGGTVFHRVIPTCMIQGGGFNADMTQRPTRAPIVNEASNGLSNRRGTIAMARQPAPHTATAQFFINVVDNPRLDRNPEARSDGYAVFGEVVAGMEVVDRIRNVPTRNQGMHQNVPVEPVVIERIVAADAKTAKRKLEAADAAQKDGQEDGKKGGKKDAQKDGEKSRDAKESPT